MYPRRLLLDGTLNTRELGGFYAEGGKLTKYGSFLRSDNLTTLTEHDLNYLEEYKLKTVIDLRNQSEIDKYPPCYKDSKTVKYIHCPLIEYIALEDEDNLPTLDDLYIIILEKHDCMKKLFTCLATAEDGCTMFHCTAGKDRTGLTACVLFMLVGVNKWDIIADYQVSFTYLTPEVEKFKKIFPDMPIHSMKSEPDWMIRAYEHIVTKYSTAYNYLIKIGLKEEEIQNLKNRII